MRDIIEVIEERDIECNLIGELYRCFCPFHNDTGTPNLYIYPDTNSFYCYACNVGGSPVDFILNYDECTLREALMRASVKDPGIKVKLKELKNNNLESKDFTEQINLRISKMFMNGFKNLPSEKVFKLMKKLDDRVAKGNILFDEGQRMIEFFKGKLK